MFKYSATIVASNTMKLPIQAVQSPYYGNTSYRTPPPDLPSLLLNERIVYLGMPLVSAVTELIIAELLFLQYSDPEVTSSNKPFRLAPVPPALITSQYLSVVDLRTCLRL
jgi:hypothetical protein